MTHKVSFHRLARKDLFDLYDYVEGQSGTKTAGDYLERIEALCGRLSAYPSAARIEATSAPASGPSRSSAVCLSCTAPLPTKSRFFASSKPGATKPLMTFPSRSSRIRLAAWRTARHDESGYGADSRS